jgi:hypothetical protein
VLRNQNSVIDRLFEQRENDPRGGEGGKRILQVTSRPVFDLTFGRTRSATWFDTVHPPQGVVWLLDTHIHDERHKGTKDAYDVFAGLEAAGELFPVEVDYRWLELDRRRLDTASFADDVRRDARNLVGQARVHGRAQGTLAGVPARLAWERSPRGPSALYAAISTRPVRGARSGSSFPLTDARFLLLAEAVRQAGEDLFGPEVLVEELLSSEEPLRRQKTERAIYVVFERA